MSTFGLPPPSLNSKFYAPRVLMPVVTWRPAQPKRPPALVIPLAAPVLHGPALAATYATRIVKMACIMFGCTRAELVGEQRRGLIVAARLYAAVRMSKELGMSLPMIGRLLNRDHTSILHLIRKSEGIRRKQPPKLRTGYPQNTQRAGK